MSFLRTLLALVTVMIIAGILVYETEEGLGPGPLHPAHSQVSELANGSCSSCHHPGGRQRLANGCANCHEDIIVQIGDRSGLHGSLEPRIANDCGRCHIEHHGDRLALVSPHAFELAGIEDPTKYDHRHAPSFDLHGAHEGLDCESCHEHANATVLADGTQRFLGLAPSNNCQGCHDDVHEGSYGEDCTRCHGQSVPFPMVGEFRHRRFTVDGSHSDLRCDACHDPDTDHSIDLLHEIDPSPRACEVCHPSPHRATGTSLPVAGISSDCTKCHTTSSFHRGFDVQDHAAIGVHLRGEHAIAECSACHTPELANRPRILDRMDRCARCHDSPHDSDFLSEVIAASPGHADDESNCSLCHKDSDESFRVGTIDAPLHAHTGFSLGTPHDDLDCRACHKGDGLNDPAPYAARFPGRNPRDCRSCHTDPHEGQFDQGASEGRCIECHETTHFIPSAFDLDHHDRCGFPIDGSHRAVSCNRCHEDPTEVGSPRRFAGTPTQCAECHTDVHRGAFDGPEVPPVVANRRGCARCHDTSSFDNVSATFDHAMFTGYPLVGSHAHASCADCHGRSAVPGATGRTLGTAPTSCAACHQDPHAGQFATVHDDIARPTDCARCHTSNDDFRSLTFDHDRDARFALDRDHASLSCSACHKPQRLPNGLEVVRYRPLGTSCTDCHGGTNGREPGGSGR